MLHGFFSIVFTFSPARYLVRLSALTNAKSASGGFGIVEQTALGSHCSGQNGAMYLPSTQSTSRTKFESKSKEFGNILSESVQV